LDGVVRGGRAERERERDVGGERRTEKSGTRKDTEIEGRPERAERLEKERAERKAERSEDWRRGEFSRLPPFLSRGARSDLFASFFPFWGFFSSRRFPTPLSPSTSEHPHLFLLYPNLYPQRSSVNTHHDQRRSFSRTRSTGLEPSSVLGQSFSNQ